MICPQCTVQCVQYNKIGSGLVEEEFYDTAEVKECPKCKVLYIEYYATFKARNTIDHVKRVLHTMSSLLDKL